MLRKYLKGITVILFLLQSYIYSCEIISPSFSIPSIVKKGDTLNIVFEAKQSATSFKATIIAEYFEMPLVITSTKFENNNWQINATIPKDTPIELYDLEITCSECSDIKERSVKVIESYKDTFIFVHLSDVHIGVKENEEVFAKVIDEINLINPEFVLITGDITNSCENSGRLLMLREGKEVSTIDFEKYLGANWKEKTNEEIKQICVNEYNTFLELLAKFKVPTYIIPGNHDMVGVYNEPSKKLYEQMIGKRYYSFNYGSYHFTGCDNSGMMEAAPFLYSKLGYKDDLEEEQLKWLEEDLKKNQDKKLKFVFFHVPIHKKMSRFRELMEKYNVDMTFAGHLHLDYISSVTQKPIFVLTTSVASPTQVFGEQHRGYRIIEIKEGKIASYSYYDKYSIPYNQLNYEFKPPNNGKNYEVTCNIINNLERNFLNALIRFIMPRDANYEIINAQLIQEVIGKEFKIVYVNVNIKAEEGIEVIIRKKK